MQSLRRLKQNVESIHSEPELLDILEQKRCLRIKFGVVPTGPDLTLGHMVVLNKLRQFQDLGHEAILIIGDFTALIGHLKGRSSQRPKQAKAEIQKKALACLEQAFHILDPEKTAVRYNSEWFGAMTFEDCLQLARKVARSRSELDDFKKDDESGDPAAMAKLLYPAVHAYDSVAVQSDIELGGRDQLYNCLAGRRFQRANGLPAQVVMTLPVRLGGGRINKSLASQEKNIAFNDPPKSMFGKIMSVPDSVMWNYYRLLLLKTDSELERMRSEHPMKLKKRLACELVDKIHGFGQGEAQLSEFDRVFSKGLYPQEMPAFSWQDLSSLEPLTLIDLLRKSALFSSVNEVRRLIKEGAIKVNGDRVLDPYQTYARPEEELVIQAGKRIFLRVNR